MTSSQRPRRVPASRQQGSIIIFAALGLSLAVILLAITDMGFLYFYKREYQKAADLAAMAGARHLVAQDGTRSCEANALPAATNSAAQNLGSKNYGLAVTCGKWVPSAEDPLDLSADAAEIDAVRAVITGSPPRFMPFMGSVTISARAIALADQPLAALAIRSTIANVDSSNSALLNAVVGSLLGGAINLSAASWNGLLETDINLLNYLDALAVELGIDAGNYDQVLGADVTLGQLLEVAADVLNNGGGTGSVGAAIGGLDALSVLNLPAFDPLLSLGDLLNVQTGTPAAGLDTSLNVFNLVQGSIQLASSQCAACIAVPIALPGVAGVNIRVSAIEPPQLSSIGNPALAKADPLGDDRIFVRTAQVRSLISVDLPIAGSVLSGIEALLNDTVLSGITNAVNDLLSLDLLGVLSALLPIPIEKDVIDVKVLPTPRLDINLDAGSGQAHVTDYNCNNQKSLTVPTRTATAHLRIGKMGSSAADAASKVFSSSAAPTVDPVAILDIGTRRVRQTCLLLICSQVWLTESGTWTSNKALSKRNAFAGGGIGLKADVPVAGMNATQTYTEPPAGGLPEIGQPPAYMTVTSSDVVDSLGDALTGLQLEFYEPSGSNIGGNGLGNILFLVGSVVNTLVSTLSGIIDAVLSPLLDPLVNFLIDALGVDLNQIDVGANLSCDGGGATLVD